MQTISTTIETTPIWSVLQCNTKQGQIDFTLTPKELLFTVSSANVFGDYLSTRYDIEPPCIFKPETTYIVGNLQVEATKISGKLINFSDEFKSHRFELQSISEETLQLTLTYRKKTALYRKQATINEDNDMQVPRKYTLTSIK